MAVVKAKKVRSVKKARMHFRLAPDIKRESPAPPLSPGQGLTDFAISALSERADEILERHDAVFSMPRPMASFSNRSATAVNLRRRRAPPQLAIAAVSGRA